MPVPWARAFWSDQVLWALWREARHRDVNAMPAGHGAERVLGLKIMSECFWPSQLQEANAQLAEQTCPHDLEMTPVQRRIEPRSADDSLSGVVRCLYFADTYLRDGEARVGTRSGEAR